MPRSNSQLGVEGRLADTEDHTDVGDLQRRPGGRLVAAAAVDDHGDVVRGVGGFGSGRVAQQTGRRQLVVDELLQSSLRAVYCHRFVDRRGDAVDDLLGDLTQRTGHVRSGVERIADQRDLVVPGRRRALGAERRLRRCR